MNKFLEIVYASQIADEEQGGKWREFLSRSWRDLREL